MESAFQSGVVSASLQVILEKFADFAVKEIGLILGVDGELRKLQRALLKSRAIVDYVENNELSLLKNSSNEVWNMWLVDLEKLLYSAEDLLDEISLDLSKMDACNESHHVRNRILSSLKLKMPHEINNIRKELEDIASEMNGLFLTKLSELGANKVQTTASVRRNYFSRSSLVDEKFVIGRERDKEEIVNTLLNAESSSSNFCVIPLVGMGGIGKTTLAQIIYNDNRVAKNFALRIWVSVSVDFDLISISKSIIESITGKRCKLADLDPIQSKLQNLLCGRKFLLVLDDFWSERYGDWDYLFSPFRVGSQGSKVIVTTRSTIVSSILGTVPAYNVQTLTDENCWELIKQRAFSYTNLNENVDLEKIGRELAKKCKGLPLAAKSLGGVLRFRYSEEEWVSILQSELWTSRQDQSEIFSALRLSYYYLPSHLRRCFAYCSIFPQNHGFETEELVLLWMAEGFIQPRGDTRLEDIGAGYFKELMWRSIFQYSHDDLHGRPIYKMHDLIHSMSKLVSSDTCLCLDDQGSKCHLATENTRHLSLSRGKFHSGLLNSSKLRTLLVVSRNSLSVPQVCYELFLKLKVLRVLDLSCMGIDELPDSIDRLKHLRYLNLSENHIQKLPESITSLLGLQTLKLKNCFQFLELPTNFKNLTMLRHLDLDVKHQLNYMPSGFGNLVNLQSLYSFVVGRETGCGIGELGNMRFLRGSICITNLENVLNIMEAKEAALCEKPFLKKIDLEWCDSGDRIDQQEVLAGLQPHENLKELRITNYGGFMFPNWLSDPQCKLTNIYLQSCQYCSILPSLGQLPFLKSLHIEDMLALQLVDHHFCSSNGGTGFPSLETLTFHDMPILSKWEGLNGNDFPRLRELSVSDCPELSNLPALHNLSFLHNLNISRCPNLGTLPEQGLPVSLQILIVLDSAIIKERCRVEEGEDWSKIKGIPKIEIDHVQISVVAPRI